MCSVKVPYTTDSVDPVLKMILSKSHGLSNLADIEQTICANLIKA